ncbi:MAG: DUF1697 domain-containing protein [Acidobacteriota bacterium]
MTVAISLLRGVNVGGHNLIRMDALQALCKSLHLRDACTVLQSGNIVFRTEEHDLALLAKRLEDGIERRFKFRPDVILRTSTELKDAIARNPFAKRSGIDPSKLLVIFLARDPGPEARNKLPEPDAVPEELALRGRELYIYYPNGMARPKLPWKALEKALNTPGTGRNWNTVTKLLQIAQKLEYAASTLQKARG